MSDFKAGFDPLCPKCESPNIKATLSEDLWGPSLGQYEVVYCKDCKTMITATPVLLMNLLKNITEQNKITYPAASELGVTWKLVTEHNPE